jgi:NodT family efflux transporter outer membrane factor (OMF) lipoprotein
MSKNHHRLALLFLAASALCACEVGPNYHRAPAPTPQTYKEIAGWTPANPSDAADRADWWTMFNDPILNGLEEKVAKSNFTLAADLAAYEEAHAIVAEERAQLWPTLIGTGSASVSHNGGLATSPAITTSTSTGTTGTGTGTTTTTGTTGAIGHSGASTIPNYSLELGATWEPDLWGEIRREIENARGTAQSTYATLVNARLSAQMELAADYITLRQLDEEKRIDDETVKAYQLSLDITRNKYNAGNAAESDVDTAESALYSERAADTALGQQRGQMEHAIATLIGVPPAELTIAPTAWTLKPVDVPPGVPSTLLQRRPDVASSERLAAAASANIGVAVAGYFPSISLTGNGGTEAEKIGELFSPQSLLWSVAASGAQTIFNGGLTHAQVQAAKAAYAEAVATYRATSLSAFQQVEDNLVAQRVLAAEQPDLLHAMNAADQALKITNNEYQAGTVDYTAVVTAEATALAAHNAELNVEAGRLTTTVDLVVALGGGWNETELKSK